MSLSVMTLNCNGIRAAKRKGFFDWFLQQDIDVLCLQETKAHMHTLYDASWQLPGYDALFSDAVKKGYSGVGIYTRLKPMAVRHDLGDDLSQDEGRFLQVDLGKVSVASIYFPSGTSGDHRQVHKMAFLDTVETHLLCSNGAHEKPTILVGDWNIAHTNLDLKNWQSNQKHSGFLPEERAWIDRCIDDWGWCDVYRHLHPQKEQYTWWTYRAAARSRNVGWRIDYHWVNLPLKDKVISATVFDDAPVFSDHAPMVAEYAI